MPKVSAVLPFLNAQSTLSRAIESIRSQKLNDWELVLVDNGCTDNSNRIALNLAKEDTRIRILNEGHLGVANAFNAGLKVSKGKYIARMDADDVSHPDRLSRQVDLLDQHSNIGVVATRVRYIGDEQKNQGFVSYVNWSNSILSSQDIYLNQFVEFPLVNPSLLFRKEVLTKYGSYKQDDFPEDYELFLRLIAKDIQMTKIDNPLLDWYDSPNRLTRSDKRYSPDAFFQIKSQYLGQWLREKGHEKVWVWGAGKLAKKRSALLAEQGIDIEGHIDVNSKIIDHYKVIHFEDIPRPGRIFILSYVSNRGKRQQIRNYLESRGYQEGINFLLAA
ncbi:MAG: glycosyltransferase family 2 protein [Cyclobacteriaceae bacterium]|nr:glycosyltransferase family 2 protein [Cyclobacteriaceae bacterium HetDA_MAG_MS6]